MCVLFSERSSTIRAALAKSSPWHTAPSQGSLLLPLATEVSDPSRPGDPQNPAVRCGSLVAVYMYVASRSFCSEHQASSWSDSDGSDFYTDHSRNVYLVPLSASAS